jgi:uncharacterized protein (TIGR03435 family)
MDTKGYHNETGREDETGIAMQYTNISMDEFAANMQSLGDGRPVVDQTGLAGRTTLH